jgi:hypothetical protein
MKTPGRRSGNLYTPGTVLVAVYQLVAVENKNGGVAASWLSTIQNLDVPRGSAPSTPSKRSCIEVNNMLQLFHTTRNNDSKPRRSPRILAHNP